MKNNTTNRPKPPPPRAKAATVLHWMGFCNNGSDLAGLRPPSSRRGPNRAWMIVNAVAHNLFMLMRRKMFRGWEPRLKRFRQMVYQVSCRLARSGRETLLRLHKDKHRCLVRW